MYIYILKSHKIWFLFKYINKNIQLEKTLNNFEKFYLEQSFSKTYVVTI